MVDRMQRGAVEDYALGAAGDSLLRPLARYFSMLLGALLFVALAVSSSPWSGGGALAAEQINIYSFRQEVLLRPLLDEFTARTGIEVKLVSTKADVLLERLRREGENSPADILLTADAGRLYRAKQAGVLQPVGSVEIERLIPAQYRDADGYWFGLSLRARPIMYAKGRVDPATVQTYAALAEPAMKDRVCVRSSSNIYNQSMLAAMIAHDGVAATEAWAKGLVANFARQPSGGDRDQIRAVAAGACDVAIANTYYLARLATSNEAKDRAAARAVAIAWPDQDGWGTHVNVSGAGVTRSAKNKANAIRLIEFLAGDEAQKIYASTMYEYPLRAGIPLAPVVADWGAFKADQLDLTVLGANNAEALRLADRAGWR